jgi:hypothetical protein
MLTDGCPTLDINIDIQCKRGVYYSGVKLFSTLLSNITVLKNDKKQFRFVSRSGLQSNVFTLLMKLSNMQGAQNHELINGLCA